MIASLLLMGGALMQSFPLLVFAGIAPLYAIADHAKTDKAWNKLELVGAALAFFIFTAHFFDTEFLVPSLAQSIVLTLAFVAFTFTRRALGPRLGKLPLIFFWLSAEYLFVKLHFHDEAVFLADILRLKPEWVRWNTVTGYLGVTLWILVANLLAFHGIFTGVARRQYLAGFVFVIAIPIIYSYNLPDESVTRDEMIKHYGNHSSDDPLDYGKNGEWIPRTATWISVLVLLSAVIKRNIRK